jgi:hypothetical protein
MTNHLLVVVVLAADHLVLYVGHVGEWWSSFQLVCKMRSLLTFGNSGGSKPKFGGIVSCTDSISYVVVYY